MSQFCGSRSALMSRSAVTSAATAGQANMLLASNAAWIETLRPAIDASYAIARHFAARALGDSLHYLEGGVRSGTTA
jgi:hypothetical protein